MGEKLKYCGVDVLTRFNVIGDVQTAQVAIDQSLAAAVEHI
jgi:hypothetical protein